MRKTNFIKSMALFLGTTLMICGCSGSQNKKTTDTKNIGIIQLVQHPALDKAREGFIEGLKELGYEEGKNIKVDYQNASGDVSNCATIAGAFANDKKDLILAIASPAAQAVAQKIKDRPILVTAVTDPKSAGLVDTNENVGGNVTGTSDKSPIKKQLKLLKEILPNCKKLGFIYSSAEDNSRVILEEVKEEVKNLGIEIVEATVQNSNDIQTVTQNLVSKVDAIYAPTDNVVSSSMVAISEIATKANIPILAAEEAQVENGALCTIGIDYKELGKQTAKMADLILKGNKKASDLPIEYQEKTSFSLNEEVAKKLGIDVDKIRKLAGNE